MARGAGTIWKRGEIWWIQVCVDGRVIRQSSHSPKYEVAKRLRDKLLGQRARGELGGPEAKLLVDSLLDHFLKCLAVRVRENTLKIQSLVIEANLRPYFGRMKGTKITTESLLAYRNHREGQGASPSTVNRELSLLRNCMRTAAHSSPPLIPESSIPRFNLTNEDSCARQGFLDDQAFSRLEAELPSYLVPLAVTGFNTGIRKGELLKIEWGQVDFQSRLIRLHRGETKTGDPRTCPMLGEMYEVLSRAKADRDANWPNCDWVFHRLGSRLKDFRGAWDSACDRAGLEGLQFHDLRRSAVRNMSRAGIPDTVAMRISGHKTRSMWDRYDITDEGDLADAVNRMQQYRSGQTGGSTPKSTDTTGDTGGTDEKGSGSLQSP